MAQIEGPRFYLGAGYGSEGREATSLQIDSGHQAYHFTLLSMLLQLMESQPRQLCVIKGHRYTPLSNRGIPSRLPLPDIGILKIIFVLGSYPGAQVV